MPMFRQIFKKDRTILCVKQMNKNYCDITLVVAT